VKRAAWAKARHGRRIARDVDSVVGALSFGATSTHADASGEDLEPDSEGAGRDFAETLVRGQTLDEALACCDGSAKALAGGMSR